MERSFAFAVKIVALIEDLTKGQSHFLISNQLGRSGTSIGANLKDADAAVGKKGSV